ncbi:MAG: TrkA family potassium uptake protein [Candidatus Nanohaloarchaea archaeon]
MYIVIAGITPLGRKLVDKLEDNHDVVVIDEDKDKCERLYSSSGATVINKSPSTLTALEDAGITQADVMISVLSDDNENMVVCSLSKKYGVPKVVSKVEDDEYLEAFQIIGAEAVAHTDLLLSEFLSAVEHPYLVKLANITNRREILKASVSEGSRLEGMTVSEVEQEKKFPSRFKVISLVQEDQTLAGDINVELSEDDELIIIGPSERKRSLDTYFQNQ